MRNILSAPGGFPLVVEDEKANIVKGKVGDIYIDFRGGCLLGVIVGILYWKPVDKSRYPVEARQKTTMVGNNPTILSSTSRTGIVTKDEFDQLVSSQEFANVLVVRI